MSARGPNQFTPVNPHKVRATPVRSGYVVLDARAGERLRRMRVFAGLTTDQAGTAAGISGSGMARIERTPMAEGRASVKASTLGRIADAIGVTVREILEGSPTWDKEMGIEPSPAPQEPPKPVVTIQHPPEIATGFQRPVAVPHPANAHFIDEDSMEAYRRGYRDGFRDGVKGG